MKIVVAPDSFKGSIDAIKLCDVIEEAVASVFPKCEVVKLPVADGGEGTVDSLLATLKGRKREIEVKNPLGKDGLAYYGIFNENNAIIEMASASGLPLISEANRNIMVSNTFGTGQLILDAVESGCDTIYLGIGGSATNDGGMGCMAALGVRFLDAHLQELEPIPENFHAIRSIDSTGIPTRVLHTKFVIMCDVKNPLLGEYGATYVYGPQKGATKDELVKLEAGMANYSQVVEQHTNRKLAHLEGAGAAGGLGMGLMAFVNAEMKSGVDTILEILRFDEVVEGASLVITGEGRMDYQSAYGKVAYGVGMRSKNANVPCIALVGGMGERAEEMFEYGIDSIMTTVNGVMSLEEAIQKTPELCFGAAVRALRMVRCGRKMDEY